MAEGRGKQKPSETDSATNGVLVKRWSEVQPSLHLSPWVCGPPQMSGHRRVLPPSKHKAVKRFNSIRAGRRGMERGGRASTNLTPPIVFRGTEFPRHRPTTLPQRFNTLRPPCTHPTPLSLVTAARFSSRCICIGGILVSRQCTNLRESAKRGIITHGRELSTRGSRKLPFRLLVGWLGGVSIETRQFLILKHFFTHT